MLDAPRPPARERESGRLTADEEDEGAFVVVAATGDSSHLIRDDIRTAIRDTARDPGCASR